MVYLWRIGFWRGTICFLVLTAPHSVTRAARTLRISQNHAIVCLMDEKQLAKRQKMLERIKDFTLMDDDFMTRFFDGDNECTQFVLRTILGRDDLTVTKAVAQKVVKSLKSRSVRLDVYAVDSEQKPYDIEIQRADEGAGARRARYNSAMMDADETVTGMDTENLSETYVIFITENDIYGKSQPLYKIERYIDGVTPFNDGSHIIYVNGKYRGNDPIGDLMHDFSCKKSEDMKNSVLADKVRRMKENEQEVTRMGRIMEELQEEARAEAKEERNIEVAEEMLKEGSLPLEKIARFSKLPLETVKQLSEKLLVVQA